MSSSVSEAVAQTGKLVVHVAKNGQSDQLLLCLDSKREPHRTLSAYPEPVLVDIVDIPDPSLPSPSQNSVALDDASDPALKALPSYEMQFRYHFHRGHAIYSRTQARFEACERLLEEQKVQEKALEIARGNLDHFYKMINQNYVDFMKCYSQQHHVHTNLLAMFVRDKEKLRSIRVMPALQTANRKCLLDFVKEESLQKTWEDCNSLHKQFQNKVSEFLESLGTMQNI
ncbi:hypothetical protein SASPL_114655 [Salvia splendens]|uniref:Autophagy protein ATG17-like domain-containing protein n=1 Tax=Salvia splendens TaxID=180675 RepID=A0A8X8Y2D6_SALSN|nr:hypothetical protein SASPL_114655 [Salvia splendens]